MCWKQVANHLEASRIAERSKYDTCRMSPSPQ